MHVAEVKAEVDAGRAQFPDRPPQSAHGVLAHAAVCGVVDGGLDDGRIDTQFPPLRHPGLARDDDQAFQKRFERLTVERLSQTDHRLGVGYLSSIDPAEPSVDEATGDLSLELVVAPSSPSDA
jgi:hypothetical protein